MHCLYRDGWLPFAFNFKCKPVYPVENDFDHMFKQLHVQK